jgi:hypothetical protein
VQLSQTPWAIAINDAGTVVAAAFGAMSTVKSAEKVNMANPAAPVVVDSWRRDAVIPANARAIMHKAGRFYVTGQYGEAGPAYMDVLDEATFDSLGGIVHPTADTAGGELTVSDDAKSVLVSVPKVMEAWSINAANVAALAELQRYVIPGAALSRKPEVMVLRSRSSRVYAATGNAVAPWTAVIVPYSLNWSNIKYAGGQYVANTYGDNPSRFAYSADGVTWFPANVTGAGGYGYINLARNGNRWLSLANGFAIRAYSDNGIDWDIAAGEAGSPTRTGLIGFGGYFVLVKNGTVANIYISATGLGAFTVRATGVAAAPWCSLATDGVKLVAVSGYYSQDNKVLITYDLVNFALHTLPVVGDWQVIWTGRVWFVVNYVSLTAYSSPTAETGTWTARVLPENGQHWVLTALANGTIFIGTKDYKKIYRSIDDGATWTEELLTNDNNSGIASWTAAASDGQRVVVLADSTTGTIANISGPSPGLVVLNAEAPAAVVKTGAIALAANMGCADARIYDEDECASLAYTESSDDPNAVVLKNLTQNDSWALGTGYFPKTKRFVVNAGTNKNYSDDFGQTWQACGTTPAGTGGEQCAVNDTAIIFGYNATHIARSVDGINWTAEQHFALGGGGANGRSLMTLPDGQFAAFNTAAGLQRLHVSPSALSGTWAQRQANMSVGSPAPGIMAAAHNGFRTVAVSGSGGTASDAAWYSDDSFLTYTQFQLPSSQGWKDICWNGRVFAAACWGATLAVSPTGLPGSWILRTHPAVNTFQLVALNSGTIYLMPLGGDVLYYTKDDGITWIAINITPTGYAWRRMAGDGVRVVCPAHTYNKVFVSSYMANFKLIGTPPD